MQMLYMSSSFGGAKIIWRRTWSDIDKKIWEELVKFRLNSSHLKCFENAWLENYNILSQIEWNTSDNLSICSCYNSEQEIKQISHRIAKFMASEGNN